MQTPRQCLLAYKVLGNGELLRYYADQQATFIANGAVDGATALAPADFVLTGIMEAAAK